MNTSYLATLHYHRIRRLLVHRCLSLYALLMLTGSVLLLSHSAPALAADSPAFAFVVNYGSRTVSRYQVDLADGRLIPQGDTPTGAGPVSITLHPHGQSAYVVNSGDRNIWTYTLSPTGKLTPQTPAADLALPTGGFAVHPNGLLAYATSSAFLVPGGGPGTGSYHTISMYTVNPQTGNLTKAFETPTPGWSVAPGFVVVHPSLNVLYVADDLSDGTISIYALDAHGHPQFTKWVRTGQNPSMLTIDAAGRVLYAVNQGGGGGQHRCAV